MGLRHPEGQVAKATCHPCLSGHARVQLPLPEAPTAALSELLSARPSRVCPPVVPALTGQVCVLHVSFTTCSTLSQRPVLLLDCDVSSRRARITSVSSPESLVSQRLEHGGNSKNICGQDE